jgi:hypothetical protein
MNGHQDRTARIRQMRETGDSVEEIASTLDTSMGLVQQIARRFETEEVLSSRSKRFLAHIRNADILAINLGLKSSEIAELFGLHLYGYSFRADLQGVAQKPLHGLVNRRQDLLDHRPA